jgi:hypothetical protein
MQKFVSYSHRAHYELYFLTSMKVNFYALTREGPYDDILKTHDYFQNININIVFLLNIFIILYAKHCKIFSLR